MCTRFVHRGEDIITGFNFDIDLSVWTHRVMTEKDRFYIGILRPDGTYHSYHGVNRNGNTGTLLYVHGNPAGAYRNDPNCMTVAELTEQFINAHISLDDAIQIVQNRTITYAADATMQTILSDIRGRVLIVEPGLGHRIEQSGLSLITNYSLISPNSTKPFIVPGDDRYERALDLINRYGSNFSVADAMEVLREVRQEGEWATRVSFVYSAKQNTVFFVENNNFNQVSKFAFN